MDCLRGSPCHNEKKKKNDIRVSFSQDQKWLASESPKCQYKRVGTFSRQETAMFCQDEQKLTCKIVTFSGLEILCL